MVGISIDGETLCIEVLGWHKLWSLKSRFNIPLEHVTSVSFQPDSMKGWYKGLRLPGTHIPGIFAAGTFYRHGERHFWDAADEEKAIVIDLVGESYSKLIVEVADPLEAVALITAALDEPQTETSS